METKGAIEYSIVIDASPEVVWDYLKVPDLMRLWMGDPEMQLDIVVDWTGKRKISIKGFHHVHFENKGIVEIFDVYHRLKYVTISSISRLADLPENYTSTEFNLEPAARGTKLTIQVENFPTDSIYQHQNFYWRGTLLKIKQAVES
jgi:uncharacterized protein YndB with AHSA1/START domain